MAMLSMLVWSLALIPLVLTNPWVWLVLIIVSAIVVVSRSVTDQRALADDTPRSSRWHLAWLVAGPLLSLLAGAVLWKKWEDPTFVPLLPEKLSLSLVGWVALIQLPIAIWVIWQRRPLPISEAAAVLFACVWTCACLLVSSMAVTGDWL